MGQDVHPMCSQHASQLASHVGVHLAQILIQYCALKHIARLLANSLPSVEPNVKAQVSLIECVVVHIRCLFLLCLPTTPRTLYSLMSESTMVFYKTFVSHICSMSLDDRTRMMQLAAQSRVDLIAEA